MPKNSKLPDGWYLELVHKSEAQWDSGVEIRPDKMVLQFGFYKDIYQPKLPHFIGSRFGIECSIASESE